MAVPPAVVTETVPVVPAPMTATIFVDVLDVIDETAVPPIFTAVAAVKLVPFIVIDVPTQPFVEPKLEIVGDVENPKKEINSSIKP